jgi:hypothetical protein
MDEGLKEELRKLGLLPLSLDERAQEEYKRDYQRLGLEFDISKIETHFTPGTPQDILQKQQTILTNVDRLHEMEVSGQTASADYTGLVRQIRHDLNYIRAQEFNIGLRLASHGVPLTGVVGVNRDQYIP